MSEINQVKVKSKGASTLRKRQENKVGSKAVKRMGRSRKYGVTETRGHFQEEGSSQAVQAACGHDHIRSVMERRGSIGFFKFTIYIKILC